MPESLLKSPCDSTPAGTTVRALAKAYVANTQCIGQHKLLLEKQKKYRDEAIKIYGNGK